MGFVDTFIESRLGELKGLHGYRTMAMPSGLGFVSNDYLGLARHPAIVEAGREALLRFGAGSAGSRLLGGHSRVFEETEEKIAAFFGAPAALFFSSGYLANLAAVAAAADAADVILSDALNHASLIDAIRLTGKPKRIVPHGEWKEAAPEGRALLVTESLFSMDGDAVDADAMTALARKSGACLLVDEAHAAGVFGGTGRGLFEAPDWDQTVKVVTFGKAFGVAGGAVCCSVRFKEWLVNRARSFIYTTAPPPAVAAMVTRALDVVAQESWRREELGDRAAWLRRRFSDLPEAPVPKPRGAIEERSPILAFHVPGNERSLRFSENMRELGLDFRAIRRPTVAGGTERIRISLSLNVSRDNTESMAELVVSQWKEFLSRERTPGSEKRPSPLDC